MSAPQKWVEDKLAQVTPAAEREQLGHIHMLTNAQRATRSRRERTRLAGLQLIGLCYRSRLPEEAPTLPNNVLVIRPDHLGDLLFLTPALHQLREALPAARITALVGPWGKPVLENHPDVDRVLTCPFPGFTRAVEGPSWQPYHLLWKEARRLRKEHFDLALIMRFDHWWGAWLAAAASVPTRIGYAIPEVHPFLTHPLPYTGGQHEVRQNLTLTGQAIGQAPAPLGWQSHPLRFPITLADAEWAAALLRSRERQEDRPWIAIHPGAGAVVKQWRPTAWAAAANVLQKRYGARIIITGGPRETRLVQQVTVAMQGQALVLVGRTTLGQLAALLARCQLVIGPDSGPLHLAVAVGTPTVHLYGPVDWRTFGPWGDPARHLVVTSDWPCIPCNRLDYAPNEIALHRCVHDITVAQVLDAVDRVISGVRGL